MTITRFFGVLAGIAVLGTNAFADDVTPAQVFEKVAAKYKAMQTYRAEGSIVNDIDALGRTMKMETSFSIILKKPNQYLITWTTTMVRSGMMQSGAAWSDGTQPYLYMHVGPMNAYSKMLNDESALASATGISNGATFTIPSLFLSVFKKPETPFARLRDPKIERSENVGDEECYVISGSSTTSKGETFWISKSRNLILKYCCSLESPQGGVAVPAITDNEIEKAIKDLGQEVTEQAKKKVREMMEKAGSKVMATKLKGMSTETQTKISSPELEAKNFQYVLPAGAVLKKSVFGGMLDGSK